MTISFLSVNALIRDFEFISISTYRKQRTFRSPVTKMRIYKNNRAQSDAVANLLGDAVPAAPDVGYLTLA
jgi:hypothetical protein